ncbi:MAG: hypothetical protein M0031_06245 [Thermaerobacter sp.]|jgi:hypothetical protein|nr:hypothetical protein [Thermaerobacter sp.]
MREVAQVIFRPRRPTSRLTVLTFGRARSDEDRRRVRLAGLRERTPPWWYRAAAWRYTHGRGGLGVCRDRRTPGRIWVEAKSARDLFTGFQGDGQGGG